jgi:hypothetical protein
MEEWKTTCPYCEKEVIYYWDNGVVSKPLEYLLIADWICHTKCWDKFIEEKPP